MRLMKIPLFTLVILLAANGCSESVLPRVPRPGVPFVHKIDIQQGNIVTQQMVAQLRLGMNKKKVRFVMGTPIIQDTFHSSRWDYVYTFHEGGKRSDERRLITVVFNEDGQLTNLEGNITPALGKLVVDKHQDTSVEVPGEYEKSILSKLKDSMPFTGDDEPELADEESADEADKDDGEKSDDKKSKVAGVDDDEELTAEEAAKIAEAEKSAITVPGGAPPKKKKGFFQRLADSVGLGADDDDLEVDKAKDEDLDYDPDDPKYRDQTAPGTLGGDG
jgi:outer membrane protein assembly factor BamE